MYDIDIKIRIKMRIWWKDQRTYIDYGQKELIYYKIWVRMYDTGMQARIGMRIWWQDQKNIVIIVSVLLTLKAIK